MPGRHFLQIPGPTNVPDRVLRAIAQPTIDHRGPEFSKLVKSTLDSLRKIFQTNGQIVVYPSSGTGAWEAALVNTLSPGDMLSAADAVAAGLINHIVASSEISTVVRELATTIAGHAPLTIRATKEMLRRLAVQRRLAEGADADLIAMCYTSDDFKEGVTAFLEKRKPVWRGR